MSRDERHGGGGHRHHRGRYVATPDEPGTLRLFFAVPVPQPTCERIGALMATVQAAVGDGTARIRWVRVEGLHLTLRFLGATPEADVPTLIRLGDEVAARFEPFDVELAGGGAFPGVDRPRSLWVGVTRGAERLAELADELSSAAVSLGRPIESRPFAPHLTLGRTDGVRLGSDAAIRLVEAAEAVRLPFRADRVVLYRSRLGDGPARYEPLHDARLGH